MAQLAEVAQVTPGPPEQMAKVAQLSQETKLAIRTFLWLKPRYLSVYQCDAFFVS